MRCPSRLLGALVLTCSLLGLHGCASLQAEQTRAMLAQPPADIPARLALYGTPFFPQSALQCGPAALATVMQAAGVQITPDELTRSVFLPGRQGSLQIDMLAAPRSHGLISTRIAPHMSGLLHEVAAGHPVVVLLNLGLGIYPMWHYAVVMGYDLPAGDVLMRSGTTELQRMPMFTFEHTWARSGQWAFVVQPPSQLPASASETDVSDGRVAFERLAAPPQSILAYRTALHKWPHNLLMNLGLGNALFASGDVRGAADVWQATVAEHDSAAAWNNLAMARLALGEGQAALEAAQHAVKRAQAAESLWLAPAQATLAEVRQTLSGK